MRKIKENRYGNWNGYEGGRKVKEFGCGNRGETAALEWLNDSGKILDFTVGGTRYEVHMLNVGASFPRFGGSKQSLVVEKTASMIVRRSSSAGVVDTECTIYDPAFWNFIASQFAPTVTRHDL